MIFSFCNVNIYNPNICNIFFSLSKKSSYDFAVQRIYAVRMMDEIIKRKSVDLVNLEENLYFITFLPPFKYFFSSLSISLNSI